MQLLGNKEHMASKILIHGYDRYINVILLIHAENAIHLNILNTSCIEALPREIPSVGDRRCKQVKQTP